MLILSSSAVKGRRHISNLIFPVSKARLPPHQQIHTSLLPPPSQTKWSRKWWRNTKSSRSSGQHRLLQRPEAWRSQRSQRKEKQSSVQSQGSIFIPRRVL